MDGPLTDEDFYRLVSCAAQPGAPCQKPKVHWPAFTRTNLTLGITKVDPAFDPDDVAAYAAAIDDATRHINAVDADIKLRRTGHDPDIAILLLDMEEGGRILGSGIPGLDGVTIEAAWVHLWWNGNHDIRRGAIVFSNGLKGLVRRSTVLEEIYQSLGLLTDVEGDWYTDRSIVSQQGRLRTTLGTQDIMALKRHYPKENDDGI